MPNNQNDKFDKVLDKLLQGIAPKVIAGTLNLPYQTVIAIKNRCTKTAIELKDNVRVPNQLSFNFSWSRRRRKDEEE